MDSGTPTDVAGEQPVAGSSRLLEGSLIGLSMIVVSTLVPTTFGANDDNGIINLLTNYANEPGHNSAPVLSRMMQLMLISLYDWDDRVPWYGLLLLSSLLVGLSLWCAWLLRLTRLQRLIVGPAAFFVMSYLVTRPTFTSVTLACQLAGYTTIYCWLLSRGEFRLPWLSVVVAISIAAVWRTQLSLVASAFALPVMICVSTDQWKRVAAVIVAAVVAISGVLAVEWGQRTSDESRAFAEYNVLRAAFHDTQASSTESQEFDNALVAAGWTRTGYDVYRGWLLYDNERFNADAIKQFLNVNARRVASSKLQDAWRTFIIFVWVNCSYLIVVMLTAALSVVLCNGAILNTDWRQWVSVVVVMVALLALLCVRCPQRICIPILLYLLAVTMPIACRFRVPGNRVVSLFLRGVVVVAIFVCSGIVAWRIGWDLQDANADSERLALVDQSMEAARAHFGENTTFVMLAPALGTGGPWRHPLSVRRAWEDMRIAPGGWSTHSPKFLNTLAVAGFRNGTEMIEASVDDDRVVYFGYYRGDWPEVTLENWEKYLRDYFADLDSGHLPTLVNEFDCRVSTQFSFYGGPAVPSKEGMVFFSVDRIPDEVANDLPAPIERKAAVIPDGLESLETVAYITN